MSSTLSIYGSLRFPPGGLARWRTAELPVCAPSEELASESVFSAENDLASVREVLDDVGDCYVFVRFIVDGDTLHLRAALGDDYWSIWCARIYALTQAAAALGARGELDTDDDGCYAGTLVVAGPRAVYKPSGPRRRAGTQEAALADMARIWEEVVAAERARWAAREGTAKKVTAKKVSAKKVSAKKSSAKKVSAKKVSAKKSSAKKATAKNASKRMRAKSRA